MIHKKNFRKGNFIRAFSLAAAACLLSIGAVNAQLDGSGDGGDLGGETGVPFDGGVSLLVAAAIGYGAKKAHDARKKVAEANDADRV